MELRRVVRTWMVIVCGVGFGHPAMTSGQALVSFDATIVTKPTRSAGTDFYVAQLLNQAERQIAGQHYDAAAVPLERALRLWPQRLDLQLRLARVLSWARHYDDSIQTYRDILNRHPDNQEAMAGMARVLAWKGDLRRSVQTYRQALEQYPTSDRLHRGLGQVLGWMGRLKEAEREAAIAVRLRPESASNTKTLGTIVSWRGRYDEAIRLYRSALALSPEDPDLYANLMQVYRWSRHYGESLRVYEQARRRIGVTKNLAREAGLSRWERALRWKAGLDRDYLAMLWRMEFYLPLTGRYRIRGHHSHLDRTYYLRDLQRAELRYYWGRANYGSLEGAWARYSYVPGVTPDNTARRSSQQWGARLFFWIGAATSLETHAALWQTHLANYPGVLGHPSIFEVILYLHWKRWLRTEVGLARYRDYDPSVAHGLTLRTFSFVRLGTTFYLGENSRLSLRYIPNRDLDNTIRHTFEALFKRDLSGNGFVMYRYLHDTYRKPIRVNQHYLGFGYRFFHRFELVLGDNLILGSYKRGNYPSFSLETRFW